MPTSPISTAQVANRTPYRSASASGPPTAAMTAVPANSEPAKNATTVARSSGATWVAQVCSELCMTAQVSPSRRQVPAATAGDCVPATTAQPTTPQAPPTTMNRDARTRADRRPTTPDAARAARPNSAAGAAAAAGPQPDDSTAAGMKVNAPNRPAPSTVTRTSNVTAIGLRTTRPTVTQGAWSSRSRGTSASDQTNQAVRAASTALATNTQRQPTVSAISPAVTVASAVPSATPVISRLTSRCRRSPGTVSPT